MPLRQNKAIAERILGRRLPRGTRVSRESGHLVVFQSALEQRQLWRRRLVLHAGGNPWTQRLCRACQRVLDLKAFKEYTPGKRNTVCRSCLRTHAGERKPGHTQTGTLRKTPAEISIARREGQHRRHGNVMSQHEALTALGRKQT